MKVLTPDHFGLGTSNACPIPSSGQTVDQVAEPLACPTMKTRQVPGLSISTLERTPERVRIKLYTVTLLDESHFSHS